MKKITGILIFIFLIVVSAISQDLPKKSVNSKKQKSSQEIQKQDKNKELIKLPQQEKSNGNLNVDQQKERDQRVKAVPNSDTKKGIIKKLNKKKTVGQMHTINKAMRKSIQRHRRK